MIILIHEKTGDFAENKDIAKQIRIEQILPYLDTEDKIIIDFKDVKISTQSFIHALISEVLIKKGLDSCNKLYFKNCNNTIQTLINTVYDYMQDVEEIEFSLEKIGEKR
ncbi:MAG: DUF4325 domain-containing protein [archaeon]